MQKTSAFVAQMEPDTLRNFLYKSLGTQLQLEMIDHFGNFDKKQCQMPSSQQTNIVDTALLSLIAMQI